MEVEEIGCGTELDLNALLQADRPSSFIFRMGSGVMHEAGIDKGDFVVIRRDREPENGDLVVVKAPAGFYLRLWRDGERPSLLAGISGDDLLPKIHGPCHVFGIVAGIFRRRSRRSGKKTDGVCRSKADVVITRTTT